MVSTLIPVKYLVDFEMPISSAHYMKLLFLMECLWRKSNGGNLFHDKFIISSNGIECETFKKKIVNFSKNTSTLINTPVFNAIQEIIFYEEIPDPRADLENWIKNVIAGLKEKQHSDLIIMIQATEWFRLRHDQDYVYVLVDEDFEKFELKKTII